MPDLLTGPLAAIATGTLDLNRYRALFVLPFGALVAAYGFEAWWASPRPWKRVAAVLLLLSLPLQFHAFYRDYMDRYRDASSVWFGENIKGALAEVFERRVAGEPLLVSRSVPYADVYTRFYSQVIVPQSAPETPTVIDGDTFDGRAAHPRSWLIAAADERWLSSCRRPIGSSSRLSGSRPAKHHSRFITVLDRNRTLAGLIKAAARRSCG